MAVKLQTIKDIRNYIAGELLGLYSRRESLAIAGLVTEKIFRTGRMALMLRENEPLSGSSYQKRVMSYCRRLTTGEPVQYVLGETVFYNCRIRVNRNVLIPRPETEELADIVIKENRGTEAGIIDFGTGSGCLAVALAVSLPGAKVTAVDISKNAIKVAARNASLNNAEVEFMHADILSYVMLGLPVAGIFISNPPYVRESEKKLMRSNVLDFEPGKALFVPDNDPLRFYRAILNISVEKLNPGGLIYFEINEAMGDTMHDLLEKFGFSEIRIIKDINGKDRFAAGRKTT
ncbi:MAG: peptide chain release factor N(5)-glutamine methyltransferase [Bacteroidales bacterium]|nr:peptide chain release factor N(5)-glutamine methyltransferase [Bacteroidales bacterium]